MNRSIAWSLQPSLGLVGLLFAACSGSSVPTSAETSAALDSAQCTYQADRATADACFAAFHACVTVDGANLDTCRATLQTCLPLPPPRRGGPPDGSRPPRPPGPPPDADGGMCRDGHGGPGNHHGHGGPEDGPAGRRPEPDSAAVQACHAALDTCLSATPGEATCLEADRSCMQSASAAAFATVCATAASCQAATDPDCARLQQRCAEGVEGRPEAFDGGACP